MRIQKKYWKIKKFNWLSHNFVEHLKFKRCDRIINREICETFLEILRISKKHNKDHRYSLYLNLIECGIKRNKT